MNKLLSVGLPTVSQGALSQLEHLILTHVTDIESWFRKTWAHTPAPMMSSVDLRHAGFKLAPVDTNLFPAGFNNLNPQFYPLCVQAVQAAMSKWVPSCRCVLLVPEAHTRNVHYIESLTVLNSLFVKAGFDVVIGHWEQTMDLGNGLKAEKITRIDDRLKVGNIEPCVVILNNDLSSGIPPIFQGIKQFIYPHLHLGWAKRKKSDHFTQYAAVAEDFAALLGCDPWLINPLMRVVNDVDFLEKLGLDALAETVDELLISIQSKYDEYQIKEKPFAVVKADNGTYGMSVMMVNDSKHLLELNRKQRNKMAVGKGGQVVNQVLVQEGIYTFESMANGAVAEPVVYMIGSYVVGGFYRTHQTKGVDDNLNAPGMHFEPLAFDSPCNMPSCNQIEVDPVNRFYVYGVIARLAAVAAGREMKEVEKQS